jgi:hypothetical protein
MGREGGIYILSFESKIMVRSCLSEQLHDRKQHNIPFSLVIKNIPKFLRSKMSYYKNMNFYI